VVIDEAGKTARVVVPDDQLSLAIGKEGQNARLAARLTGWKIDIKSETQAKGDPLFQLPEPVEISDVDEPLEQVVEQPEHEIEMAEPVEEFDADTTDETEEQDKPKTEGAAQPSVADVEALLAKLNTMNKRKTWEERFGSVLSAEEVKANEEKAKRKEKKKKEKEKVIKDFSMLSLEDFQFDDED